MKRTAIFVSVLAVAFSVLQVLPADGAAEISRETALLAAMNAKSPGSLRHCESYTSLDGETIAYEFLFEKRDVNRAGEQYRERIEANTNVLRRVPAGGFIRPLLWDRTFLRDFNDDRFSREYLTVVVSATRDRGPILAWYDGLPQSVKLKKIALDLLDDRAGIDDIASERFLYFKIGFLYLYLEVASGEHYLLSPDERLIEVDGRQGIEYLERGGRSVDVRRHHHQWDILTSGPMFDPQLQLIVDSYTIVDAETIRDIFYNRGRYWPESDHPYLYDDGDFGGCCHANSGLQVALYYDDHGYGNLVPDPNAQTDNRLQAMDELVYEGYAPGQRQSEAFRDFANAHGYDFSYDFDWYISESTLKDEINADRPVQYLIFSDDQVTVLGYPFEQFAHSTLAVGYTDGAEFTVKLYWGWSSLPEIEFEWGSDFAEQFEDQNIVKNLPGGGPDPEWIVINEVYADPAPGLFGDANRDGIRDTYKDEFVELYNTGLFDVDISGWSLGDDDADPFVFPRGTVVPADSVLTVFGGGDTSALPGIAVTAGGRIGNGLANSGDTIILKDPWGNLIDQFAYPQGGARGDKNVSMMLVPDGIGYWLNPAKDEGYYSPGSFNNDDAPLPAVVLNEVLADPPDGLDGDANNDGVRNGYQDEFIEIMNIGGTAVDISWYAVTDDDPSTKLFRFPEGTILEPGEYAVVFGGGDPQGIPGLVFASTGRLSNGLANAADRAMLTNPNFKTIDSLYWPDDPVYGDDNVSMIRVPDGTGGWRLPLGEEPLYSPGVENVEAVAPANVVINEVLADPPPDIEGDANGDGVRHSSQDEFVELVNVGLVDADISGWTLTDNSGIGFTVPNSTVLAPGGYLTVFGGGVPTGVPGIVFTSDGTIGSGLGNSGDVVILTDLYLNVVDRVDWPDGDLDGGIDVSMIRLPDGTGGWVNSLPPMPAYSAGTSNDGG